MSNFVFVVDTNKQPLNPIHPGLARRLLQEGFAAVYRRYPFVIILKHAVADPKAEPHQLKIDPGSKTTGIAIIQGDGDVIWGAELAHRGQQVKDDLTSRRSIRRSRRNRKTRYRQPPKHEWSRIGKRMPCPQQRRDGWLPPSLESRIENTLTWVNRIRRYALITGISQELVKFDTQLMQTPEILGTEYQQGELAGY